jgi:hypothetical protein
MEDKNMEQCKGPNCQSCGMPMEITEDFGTDENASKVNDYCNFCFQNGKFTAPDMTLQQMQDLSASCMVKYVGTPEDQAKEIATNFIPTLKRWKA